MAEKKPQTKKTEPAAILPLWRRVLRWIGCILGGVVAFYLGLIVLFSFLPPPGNIYQWQESWIEQIRDAIANGKQRGASTISQQVVKNVFLWQGRSYLRKALEAIITPVVELMWSKQRILEVYLNEAEFAEGVFGVQAAAQVLFDTDAAQLTATQSARLAAVLPNPKERNAAKPSGFVRSHAAQIRSGAETIKADGRAACFETAD
jgi:monofunctional biosynthetic peptidoglycan transglycosylase